MCYYERSTDSSPIELQSLLNDFQDTHGETTTFEEFLYKHSGLPEREIDYIVGLRNDDLTERGRLGWRSVLNTMEALHS